MLTEESGQRLKKESQRQSVILKADSVSRGGEDDK
jgi:hypothetical protein